MTASSLASVSLHPPLVSVCIDHTADLHDAIAASEQFVVNILEGAQESLSRRFADQHPDRFEGVGYHRTPEGLVLLRGWSCWTGRWPTSSASVTPRIPVATIRS
jgi:flavin reductase